MTVQGLIDHLTELVNTNRIEKTAEVQIEKPIDEYSESYISSLEKGDLMITHRTNIDNENEIGLRIMTFGN